jgi:hypothetical protein
LSLDFAGQHPGFAVTGSPVPFYFPVSGISSAALPDDFNRAFPEEALNQGALSLSGCGWFTASGCYYQIALIIQSLGGCVNHGFGDSGVLSYFGFNIIAQYFRIKIFF